VNKKDSESNVEETSHHEQSGVCECGDPAQPHLVGLRGALTEEESQLVREWIWVLAQLVEAGKTPHAVVALDETEERIEVVTSLVIEDVPKFFRQAAEAIDETEDSRFIDCTSH